MRKRFAAPFIIAAYLGSGCRSATVDVLSTFILDTTVKTETNEILGGVTVSFVDTGLDARRA